MAIPTRPIRNDRVPITQYSLYCIWNSKGKRKLTVDCNDPLRDPLETVSIMIDFYDKHEPDGAPHYALLYTHNPSPFTTLSVDNHITGS